MIETPGEARKEYSFLNDEDWDKVLEIFRRDVVASGTLGLTCVAPEFPEAGQETMIWFDLETAGMQWADSEYKMGKPLSKIILRSYDGDRAEIESVAASLENTIAVLRAALKRMVPVSEPFGNPEELPANFAVSSHHPNRANLG